MAAAKAATDTAKPAANRPDPSNTAQTATDCADSTNAARTSDTADTANSAGSSAGSADAASAAQCTSSAKGPTHSAAKHCLILNGCCLHLPRSLLDRLRRGPRDTAYAARA